MRKECQVKIRGSLDHSLLLERGAQRLGQVVQKDTYLATEDGRTVRIREQNGHHLLTHKGRNSGRRARIEAVNDLAIAPQEAERRIAAVGVRAVICKNREIFQLGESVITLDAVEHLDEFIEIRSPDEKTLFAVLKVLELDRRETIMESYLDMMLAKKLPAWLLSLIRFHDRVGELIFGITSGVLTTVGALVGMDAATDSRRAVIAGILVIAVADSLSDSYGMYQSKLGERGTMPAAALRYAFGTFAGKFILPLTFVIPLAVSTDLFTAVAIDIVWGFAVLTLLNAERALVSQASVLGTVSRNVGFAAMVVGLSAWVGWLVSKLIA